MISGIGDSLDTTIGKVDNVGSSNISAGILVFVLGEVSTRVTVLYSIFVGKWLWGKFWFWGWLMVCWGRGMVWCWSRGMVWCWWGSSWDSTSGSNDSSSNDSLRDKYIIHTLAQSALKVTII